jgi:cell division protein FtsZ
MINFQPSSGNAEPRPRITVIGVGGAGGNAVNNMIQLHLEGVEFVVANTDAQSLRQSRTDRRIQLGAEVTQGLGAGARPDVGRAAAQETLDEIVAQITGSNMVFIAAGMGGGTGTGAAPVIAQTARDNGILTVGVVTKPFHFEGAHRMRLAEAGIEELSQYVDTLIVIPNQNLFRLASEKTTFADAFRMADDVLYSGVRGVTDLMVMPGLINLDFADIRTVMGEMGKAMMGTGEGEGPGRALDAAEAAIRNPLLEDTSMKGAKGVLINITGGLDMTLFEVDEAANRIRDEVDGDANIIFGSTFDEKMEGRMRVSVVATGIDARALAARPVVTPEYRRTAAPTARIVEEPAAAKPMPEIPAEPVLRPATAGMTAAAVSGGRAKLETEADMRDEGVSSDTAPALTLAPAGTALGGLTQEDAASDAIITRAEIPELAELSARTAAETREPAPAFRATPVQGSLGIDEPTLPLERKVNLHAIDVGRRSTEPEPMSRPSGKQEPSRVLTAEPTDAARVRRPGGFLNRLANSMKAASAYIEPSESAPANKEPAPAESVKSAPAPIRQAGKISASPAQPTRISPSERLPMSRSAEEDLLDIPAFLRRQAN